MCAHLSQLRIRLAVSLLQGPASVCPFAQRAFAQHGGPQWYSKQQSYGFHTAVAAAKRSSDGCRSLNWLALIRTRMHQDNSYSTHVHTRQEPTSERDLPCYRSLAVTSPFLPVLRPAMRYAQTATTTPISPSSSGDSLASMDESTDGSAPVPSASTEAADEWKLEYTGSLSGTIRTLKARFRVVNAFVRVHYGLRHALSSVINSFLPCRLSVWPQPLSHSSEALYTFSRPWMDSSLL